MIEKLNKQLDRLRQLNLEIRRRLELAEAHVGTANLLLAQLAVTELMNDQIFLGDVIMQRPYSVHFDTASGQIIQAALSVDSGFGAIFWDSEELAALADTSQFESEALLKHVPFNRCGSATKALLLPQLEPLLERLLRAIRAI